MRKANLSDCNSFLILYVLFHTFSKKKYYAVRETAKSRETVPIPVPSGTPIQSGGDVKFLIRFSLLSIFFHHVRRSEGDVAATCARFLRRHHDDRPADVSGHGN